jgi:hypothetical protein
VATKLLSVAEILAWADAYFRHEGRWPTSDGGPVAGTARETWHKVDRALRLGLRGLVGGSSLARLLARERGVRNLSRVPPLTEAIILSWADEHHQRTGKWPNSLSGAVKAAPGENWKNINQMMHSGGRGWPRGGSLAKLLAERRNAPYRLGRPPLTVEQILTWADAHFERKGRWPGRLSGRVVGAPSGTWVAIDAALKLGFRGLPGGSSLAHLLDEHRRGRGEGRGGGP